METKILLDIDYIIENNAPVIRLFYKIIEVEKNEACKANKRVVCITDFTPYFYAVPKEGLEELETEIKQQNLAAITRTEKVKKIYKNAEIALLKIYVRLPSDVKDIRDAIRTLPGCEEIYEADIPFTERYCIDKGITFMESNKNLTVGAFDIETYNPKIASRPNVDPILAISYAEGTFEKDAVKNTYKKVWTWKKSNYDFVENCESEAGMFRKFLQTISERDPDILVSYNGDNYDFRYMQERAKILKFFTPISFGKFDTVEKKLKFEKSGISVAAYIDGLPHVDLFPVSRQLFSLPKYDLNSVYYEIYGKKGKEDLDKSKIYEIWDNAEKDEICMQNLEKFFKYSLKDSEITLEIAFSLLPLYFELSHIIGLPLQKTTRMGSGMRVEHLLLRNSYKKNLLIPNKREISQGMEEESFTGGFVLEPEKGLHNNIVVFDFRSLYPSIIISLNIDPLTINCECCKNDQDKNIINVNNSTYWFCKKKKGFIPETLKSLVERRVELKNLMKKEENLEKKKILDVQQQALKILVNSAYGYLGFSRARWYSKECAESVTAYGRKYIQYVMDEAKKVNFDVIYGDTDSIFLTKANESKDEILSDASKFLKYINASLPGMMELDLQGFYPTGIFITKKRYALMEEDERLIVKGLETKRRDWANIAKETQKEVLLLILKEKDVRKAVEFVRKRITALKQGNVRKEDLIIYTKLTRSVDSYIQKKEPHVAAVKRAMNKGINFEEGDIIAYIVTKNGKEINEKTTIAELVEEGNYDANYYIDNQILPAVMRIMEAMNCSEDELKGMEKQMKLF